jgi:hypothetical protein
MSESTRRPGFGSRGLETGAVTAAGRTVTGERAYSNFERMVGALIVLGAGAGSIWAGLELDVRQLVSAGTIAVVLVALGALMSGFWLRFDNLSDGQRTIVDLPRRIVWGAGRVLWGAFRVIVELVGGFVGV